MGGLFFAILTVFYTLFGIFLYELRVFTFIDELFAFTIAGYGIFQMFVRKVPKNKPFIIWLCIAAFYLIYSVLIKSNEMPAIINDFIMQTKPYMVFFGLWSLKPKLDRTHWTMLQISSLLFAFILFVLFLYYYGRVDLTLYHEGTLLSGEGFSAVSILIAALYYISCESDSMMVRFTTLLIMLLGILVPTSKYFGILICCIAILFILHKSIKLNIKYLIVGIVAIVFILWFVWDEFFFYFLDEYEYNARPMLYVTMPSIMNDYFPFGSGLGTYASPASATWYSHIYTTYELDTIWGLMEEEAWFVADVYYPTLAQFGYVGVGLFILFWSYIFRQMNNVYYNLHDLKRYRTALIIVSYFLIEATSNSISNERCILAMFILVLSLYKYKTIHKRSELDTFGLKFIKFSHKQKLQKDAVAKKE